MKLRNYDTILKGYITNMRLEEEDIVTYLLPLRNLSAWIYLVYMNRVIALHIMQAGNVIDVGDIYVYVCGPPKNCPLAIDSIRSRTSRRFKDKIYHYFLQKCFPHYVFSY